MCTIYLLQGHFHLCYPAGQEDQLDLDSHLYHLFQGAQLVLVDPRRKVQIHVMVKIDYQIISISEILETLLSYFSLVVACWDGLSKKQTPTFSIFLPIRLRKEFFLTLAPEAPGLPIAPWGPRGPYKEKNSKSYK